MSLNVVDQIKQTLIKVVKESFGMEFTQNEIVIEIPKDSSLGDYATNIAMRLTKQLKRNPKEIAEVIKEKFDYEMASVEKIEIAGPGFINFFMNKSALSSLILKVIDQNENYGSSNFGEGLKVNLEYVSANPTGDLHLGHARGAAMGDSKTRIMKFAGFDVTREYYINDAGNQINNLALSLRARYNSLFDIEIEMPQDGYYGQDVIEIAKTLKEVYQDKYKNDFSEETLLFFREKGIYYELEKIKEDLKNFRVEFDVWSSEASIYQRGKVVEALEKLKALDMTYEQENAVWLKTTKYADDKDRVLVKSDGSYTYLMPDIAYHLDKYQRGFDKLVNLLGADHHGYVPRLKAAIQSLGYPSEAIEVDIIQMVRLVRNGEEVKMSKRTGNAVTLRELVEEVGIDAVRYFFVSRSGEGHVDFDLDLATSQTNENPVYYVQYAHARMCSILRLAEENSIQIANKTDLIVHDKEIELLKHINEFTNVVSDSAKTRAPHKICNYVNRLAQLFHSFYNENKVIDKTNMELSSQRLALIKATQITLQNALKLIGVEAVEKM